jgi:ectoine hydroxylase-related dioxygenase (phytanoyl-CoA dioxygenase family)
MNDLSAEPKPRLEFDPATLPWLDRVYAEIDAYLAGLDGSARPDYDLRHHLIQWMRLGYTTFPGLIAPALIDAYRADVDDLIHHRRGGDTLAMVEARGTRSVRDFDDTDLGIDHMRILDFHNESVAAKEIALHPRIVSFLGHVFREDVVMMQSLTFLKGSEQHAHQDFAYVVSEVPSHLAATWVALEDVHPDAGPLKYYPGSHSVPKFDWGNGFLFSTESAHDELAFARYLEEECRRAQLEPAVFCPRKGDVFVWHAALVHGGSATRNRALTRASLVSHYSPVHTYTRDRRKPEVEPERKVVNGGIVFVNPVWPHLEDTFPLRLEADPAGSAPSR